MRAFSALVVAAFATMGAVSAQAAVTTEFWSQAGSPIVAIAGAPVATGAVQITTPHNAWVPNGTAYGNAAAKWISTNANTGKSPSFVPPNSKATPYMVVEEMFVLKAHEKGSLSFEAYADDTARVLLNGVQLFAANFTQGTCAVGKIGCEAGEGGLFSDLALLAGINTLRFEVFQVGGSAFGLQYAGATTVTPIPAALPLLGAALAGLGFIARRRTTAA